jgi:Mrp family chromosome partitioning ATPase
MSRNFELMQLAGRGADFRRVREVRDVRDVRNPRDTRGPHDVHESVPPMNPEIEQEFAQPFIPAQRDADALDLDELASEETLRLVQRTFLQQGASRTVLFAGVDHGNGCSRLCIRIAETLASNVTGSICLVDANLRTPSLPGLFGVGNHFGLTDALQQAGPIRSFAKPMRNQKLWLLSCGSIAADSPRLLNSEDLQKRLAELRTEFDYVLIDAPPLARYGDALAVGKFTDGVVMILEANATRREVAVTVSENLRAAGIKILGAVLNKRTFPIPERLYHLL